MNIRKYSTFIIWAVLIILICIGYGWVVMVVFGSEAERGVFGDMFGGLNAAFAGLAFAGVIYAIILQRNELALQREELQLTRDELKLTREEVARSATAQEDSGRALEQQVNAMLTTAMVSQETLIEMREARIQDTSPHVIAYFDSVPGSKLLYLVIKNIGKSTAIDVRLDFSPSLTVSDPSILDHQTLFVNGISSMPPGYEYRSFIDTTIAYFNYGDLPMHYSVEISYSGGLQQDRQHIKHTLDLGALMGIISVRQKDMDDFVRLFENSVRSSNEISTAIKRIQESLNKGLFITNPAFGIINLQPNSAEWQANLFAKLNEFNSVWLNVHSDTRSKGVDLSELQILSRHISGQLLILLSHTPAETSNLFKTKVEDIIECLYQLGKFKIYGDGGSSLGQFNKLGDSIVDKIGELKKSEN